jgi:uroporphyrinogen decarboxylase
LYQPDGMPVVFDLQVEAEILGCELVWSNDTPPSVKTHPCAEEATIPCRCLLPKQTDGRLPLILETMKKIKAEVGETIALYGLICGPFTLSSHLRGNDLFMDMILDESYVKELMGFCTEVALKMIDLYIGAGMDIIAVVDPLVSQYLQIILRICAMNLSQRFLTTYVQKVLSLPSSYVAMQQDNWRLCVKQNQIPSL